MPIFHNGTWYDEAGNVLGLRSAPQYAAVTLAVGGLVVAAVAGRKIRVTQLYVNALAATNIKFQSNTTDISATLYLAANGGAVLPESEAGWFETAAGEALNLAMSVNTSVGVQVQYVLV